MTALSSDVTTWTGGDDGAGFYCASQSDVNYGSEITITGAVKLILWNDDTTPFPGEYIDIQAGGGRPTPAK